ncbi:hypothetical protein KSS87_018813 [Heliosperma pusillum]|nr:hypothetical protein KSS87_018813 [Heliosperma pusillum]
MRFMIVSKPDANSIMAMIRKFICCVLYSPANSVSSHSQTDVYNDHSQNSRSCADTKQKKSLQKTTSVNQQRALRRGNSQKDFLRTCDDYSLKDVNKLPGVAVNHGRELAGSDVLKTASTIRKHYKTKLEESEKRKEQLLAKIILEGNRGKELKKIVADLLPNAKEASPAKRSMRGRKVDGLTLFV